MNIAKFDGEILHPVYCKYDGQTGEQDAYIYLNSKTETLYADYNAEIGSAIFADCWNNHTLAWNIQSNLTAEELNELLKRIAPLAERVLSAYESKWDGNNHVGTYEDYDAPRAMEEIEEICNDTETSSKGVWDAEDWYRDDRQLMVTKDMSEEDLCTLAEQLEEEAESEGITVVGTLEYLKGVVLNKNGG